MAEAEDENYAKLKLVAALGLIPIEEFEASLTEGKGIGVSFVSLKSSKLH
jgi:hypothetical protein